MNRNAVTSAVGPFMLAVSAFHSEATRESLNPDQMRTTLEGLLAEAERSCRAAGVDPELFQDVKFACVALADELAIHSDWDHVEHWQRNLMESRHFGTTFAGAEFIDRAQRIWQRLGTAQDTSAREQLMGVLEVYHTCLRLGFQGRYRGMPGQELASTTDGLLAVLWPGGDDALRHQLWPAGYAGTGSGRVVRSWRMWWWPVPLVLALAVGLWFFFSFRNSADVDDLVNSVGQLDDGPGAAKGGR